MKKIFLALAAVSSLAGASAFAETGYIGGAVGQSHFNADCSGTTNCKTNDTGYKLFHERELGKFTPKSAGGSGQKKPGMFDGNTPEAQAHKDLPEGWLSGSVKEETILLENRPTLVVSATYPPMGADEIRWLFCSPGGNSFSKRKCAMPSLTAHSEGMTL